MFSNEIRPERLNFESSFAETKNEDKIVISLDELHELFTKLRASGFINPITDEENPDVRKKLKRWEKLRQIPSDEAVDFFKERLTEEGKEFFEEIANEDFFHALKTVPKLIEPEERKIESIKNKLQESSSLIDEQVVKQLAVTLGETTAGKVPLKAWLLNPQAAKKVLEAVAEEATAQAGVRKAISETTKWIAEVRGDDARRNALLDYTENLEEALGPYVRPFCQERNLPVPEEGTLGRMALLLRINAEMRALQVRAREITKAGEQLIAEKVEIRKETAKNQMLAEELPVATEAAKEFNVAKEAEIAEKARSFFAKIAAALSGGTIGTIGGLYAGIESSISTLVERHPKIAISLGAGFGAFTVQVVSYSGLGLPSAELLQLFVLKSSLVTGIAAAVTGIGSGLVTRLGERRNVLAGKKN